MSASVTLGAPDDPVAERAACLLKDHQDGLYRRTDRIFVVLMLLQWLAGLGAALWISPRAWAGMTSDTHPHVWDALYLGGIVTLFPVAMALWQPGRELTRHVIAIGQMVMSGLLIHFTGGRLETHFHIFGSLAFLAFYRDWRVLITASIITASDHYLRGVFWPESAYGVLTVEPWRWLEHAGWVVFEDTFLIVSCLQSTREMHDIAWRRARQEMTEERLRDRETSLKRSNSVLLAQQEASPDGILVVNEGRRVVSLNRRLRELWDISDTLAGNADSHEILRHFAAQMRDQDQFTARVQYLYDRPVESSRDELHLTDGRVFDRYSGPVAGEDGQYFGRIWCYRDITQNVRAEEALRQARGDLELRVQERTAELERAGQQTQALLDAAGEGIYGVDPDGKTTFINPAAAQILGYTSDELRGVPMHALLHHTRPDGTPYPREECPIYASLRDGDVHHMQDEVFWRRDGSCFPVDYIVTPVREGGSVAGAVVVFHDITERLQAEAQITRLNGQLEQRLDSIEVLNMELAQAYDATIAGWSRALDLRDHETEGHSLRVTAMTLKLAEAFGFTGDALLHIQRGALLHDIGKMGIPDAILNKPGPLDEDERAIMCLHPTYAYEMLAGIPFVHPALDIPYCHHEKWDGTGYPRGLGREEIPLAARLFSIVDVWDALCSDRPYRRAWSAARTCEHIASLAGTHFDPQVVEVFLRDIATMLPEDGDTLPQRHAA